VPKISVIITIYNRPDRIPLAITTAVKQTFKDMEIIVVDGANSKENQAIVNSFMNNTKIKNTKKKIRYVPVEPEAVNYISYKGIQHSRNVGCKAAKGKYIAMLDDDDSWEPTKLEKQVKEMDIFDEEKGTLGLVLCWTKINTNDGYFIDKTLAYPKYSDLLRSFNLSSTSSYLIRRDVLEEIGYWNEELRGMHEYDIALKLTQHGYWIYTIPETLMIRNRMSNITIESGHYYYFKIAEILDLWKYYGKDFIKHIGFSGFTMNVIKTVLLSGLFLFGYVIKERIWDIIYPLKKAYDFGGVEQCISQ